MRRCFCLTTFYVLVNGVPGEYFGCRRGLRQGDPLSPLLFLLVAECLGRLIGMATKCRMLEVFQVRHLEVTVSHLQFVDDNYFL